MAKSENRPDSIKRRINYLRLSVTDKCDMRCIYCNPDNAVLPCRHEELLDKDAIVSLVDALAANGITKVRITGGEPLLRSGLIDIIRSISGIEGIRTIGLTTNGRRLAEMAPDLKRAGLQRVNISLDSLNSVTFQRITGHDALDLTIKGLRAAVKCGFEKVKINSVMMRGINDSEIGALANLTREMPVDVRFIELMLIGHSNEEWKRLYISANEIRQRLGDIKAVPSEVGASAQLYRFSNAPGNVGIISPVSERFCSSCSRIRITSRGILKPCLRLPREIDLRPLLSNPDLKQSIGALLTTVKDYKLDDNLPDNPIQDTAMCAIGG